MRIVLSDSTWHYEKLDAMNNGSSHSIEDNLDLLFSYWYAKPNNSPHMKRIRDAKTTNRYTGKFYIDSGVFSARKKDVIIPVNDLIKFCIKNKDIIDYVFSMDSGSATEQLDNCKKIKNAGLPVIGIYHGNKSMGNMSLDYIERFLELSEYISLGGLVPLNKVDKVIYLDKIFEYIYKRNLWPIKIHALGVESFSILSKYPFYSADSSAYASAFRFGRISYIDKRSFNMKTSQPNTNFDAFKLDINSVKYVGNEDSHTISRVVQNIMVRHDYQKMLNEIWIKKGVIWDE